MYTQIEKEFAHQFNNTDLDFHVEYQRLYEGLAITKTIR